MRIEKDSFGEIELPSDCLYGARTARCFQNTDVGSAPLSAYPELVRALAMVKRACALANVDKGYLLGEIGPFILEACDKVQSGDYNNAFPVDMLHGGGYIGFNININEVLANLANMRAGAAYGTYAPVCPKAHVNMHQSTADACATAARLAIIERSEKLSSSVECLTQRLLSLACRFQSTETVARTCLMDAMPVSIGETFGAWAAFMDRRSRALDAAIEELHAVNLGGTVIGSGHGAPEDYRSSVVRFLCQSTGRELRQRANLYDASQNIDDLASVSAQLRLMADGLLKIAGDVRLLASGPNCGFGELILPAVQEGSSFFSGKVNPVIPETVMQVCIQVSGFDRAVSGAMEHGELNLNVFEGVALKNLLDALRILKNAIVLFTENCVDGMNVDIERCKQHLGLLRSNPWASAAK